MRELVQLMINPTALFYDHMKRQVYFSNAKMFSGLHASQLALNFLSSYEANKSVIDETAQLYWCTADMSTSGVYTKEIMNTKFMRTLMRELGGRITDSLQKNDIVVESVKVRPVLHPDTGTTHLFTSVRFYL